MGLLNLPPLYEQVIKAHRHEYTIWAIDGAVFLWTAEVDDATDALQNCPLDHIWCQWKDIAQMVSFTQRAEETMFSSGTKSLAGHTHKVKIVEPLSKGEANLQIFDKASTTCGAGHANCSGFSAHKSAVSRYTLLAQLASGETSGIVGDPTGHHYHTLDSLRPVLNIPRRITSVVTCPSGHARCLTNWVSEPALIFYGIDTSYNTGYEEA